MYRGLASYLKLQIIEERLNLALVIEPSKEKRQKNNTDMNMSIMITCSLPYLYTILCVKITDI